MDSPDTIHSLSVAIAHEVHVDPREILCLKPELLLALQSQSGKETRSPQSPPLRTVRAPCQRTRLKQTASLHRTWRYQTKVRAALAGSGFSAVVACAALGQGIAAPGSHGSAGGSKGAQGRDS